MKGWESGKCSSIDAEKLDLRKFTSLGLVVVKEDRLVRINGYYLQ